jgi:hydroxymethylbilane synthase
MASEKPIVIATRGSALALAQANLIAEQCRTIFPRLRFELKIIKTTGDKLQTASLSKVGDTLPKGLFTKELEVALVKGRADLAIHSLKDLPTDLPAGLILAATPKRADVRDVLIYRDAEFFASLATQKSDDWIPGQSSLKGFKPHNHRHEQHAAENGFACRATRFEDRRDSRQRADAVAKSFRAR